MYEIADSIYRVPQEDIVVDPGFNCRGPFTLQSIEDLAMSIKDNGLLEPIVLQPLTELPEKFRPTGDGKLRIIAGHRREAAIRLFLRWETIPSRIVSEISLERAQILNFLENLERKDLNILEEAEAIQRVWQHLTATQISQKLKRTIRWVTVRRNLTKLPEQVKQAAASGRITQKDIEFINMAKTIADQLDCFEKVMDEKAKGEKTVRYRGKIVTRHAKRSNKQINKMIAYLMKELAHLKPNEVNRIIGSLAWAADGISTEEYIDNRLGLIYNEGMFND